MATLQRRMLSKEDEAAVGHGSSDMEVRREDQDRINSFSRLHQRRIAIEEDLRAKSKEKEDLEEISTELELADEDEKIPYKIGDAFVSLPLPEVQEMLQTSNASIEASVESTEAQLASITGEMDALKAQLYARFGKSINLET